MKEVTRLIKQKVLILFLIAMIATIGGCSQIHHEPSVKIVLLINKLIPQLENRPFILNYLEGNLSTDIENNLQEQPDDFLQEPINEGEELPSPQIDDEEKEDDTSPHLTNQTGVYMDQMEQEVIELVNQLRQELGVTPLEPSKELKLTARLKSKDMSDYDYFDHQGHLTFSELLGESNITVTISGENIYRSQSPLTTAKLIFDTWKSSPTHYENMINEKFHRIGVGIFQVNENGINTYFATQHITD